MKTIVVASQNPVKVKAVRNAFKRMFPEERFEILSVSVQSGVKDQPTSNDETLKGALTRAKNAANESPDAEYWVGIEGGVEIKGEEMAAYAWIVVQSNRMTGKSRTGTFYLPPAIADLVHDGLELGSADDLLFNEDNSKQKSGAIGILTGDVITRTQLYEHAIILALVPFRNQELFV